MNEPNNVEQVIQIDINDSPGPSFQIKKVFILEIVLVLAFLFLLNLRIEIARERFEKISNSMFQADFK